MSQFLLTLLLIMFNLRFVIIIALVVAVIASFFYKDKPLIIKKND
jgi:hypothetical protein